MVSGFRKLCFVVALCALVFISACAKPQIEIKQPQGTDDLVVQFKALGEKLLDGKQRQLDVLSPTWYLKAGNSLEKARVGISRSETTDRIQNDISYAQAYLEKANDYARVSKTVVSEAVAARNAALKAHALQYPKKFQTIEKKFLELTRDVEKGEIARAKKNQQPVARAFSALELRALKKQYLGEIRTLLHTAKKARAAQLVPQIFATAAQALETADVYITEHRYDVSQIAERADRALFQTQRLTQLLTLVNKMAESSAEETVLWYESMLQQITAKLSAPDLRNKPWPVQQENILASIASLQNNNQFLQKRLKDDRASFDAQLKEKQQAILKHNKRIAILEGESKQAQKKREILEAKEREIKEKLAAEHRFQLRFVAVQKLFSKDQAEVYKQRHNLVIRLKAIRFPVGEAFITPDNYELLSIVRSAIHTFGEPSVVIEGYTDSTGSAASNEKLSQQRANAVRMYFVANDALKPEKIIAIGYGAQRPLMKNDTPEGRAINRRIDVIIRTVE
ncbi:MAG: OmpA family protein [Geopsychrobacter sp.]|nr:OmpA family protein [Geopsychrobacter sp.]